MISATSSPKPTYTITRALGSGSFGEVSLVTMDNQLLAMKTIIWTPQTPFSSIEREFNIHSFLSEEEGHPNIVKMLGRSSEGMKTMFFMEFVSGGTLDDCIEENGMDSGMAKNFFKQMLAGLEYLHLNGVVHMDIKPSNLLLDDKNILKICDFGLARFFQTEDGEDELVPAFHGTPEYAAPEVWYQLEVDGPPVDIWSAGVTLLDMLTGNKPWKKASQEDDSYVQWIHIIQNMDSHGQLDKGVMLLLRSIFNEDVEKRATLKACKASGWVVEEEIEVLEDVEEDSDDCDREEKDCNKENRYKRKRDYSEEMKEGWKRMKQ